MPLSSSEPHEYISIDVLSPRIVFCPMDLFCHGSVLTKAVVDGGVVVCLGPVLLVVGDIRHPCPCGP
jgi:hypothetical protein